MAVMLVPSTAPSGCLRRRPPVYNTACCCHCCPQSSVLPCTTTSAAPAHSTFLISQKPGFSCNTCSDNKRSNDSIVGCVTPPKWHWARSPSQPSSQPYVATRTAGTAVTTCYKPAASGTAVQAYTSIPYATPISLLLNLCWGLLSFGHSSRLI
jgi:hypothetical protein